VRLLVIQGPAGQIREPVRWARGRMQVRVVDAEVVDAAVEVAEVVDAVGAEVQAGMGSAKAGFLQRYSGCTAVRGLDSGCTAVRGPHSG
jgi:hypothetical protein